MNTTTGWQRALNISGREKAAFRSRIAIATQLSLGSRVYTLY